jgi:hypothetical protein
MTLLGQRDGVVEDRRHCHPPSPKVIPRALTGGASWTKAPVRRWRAFALLVVAYFMTIVDLTMVNVARPIIARESGSFSRPRRFPG